MENLPGKCRHISKIKNMGKAKKIRLGCLMISGYFKDAN